MDYEIIEALHDLSSQQESEVSSLYEEDCNQEREMQISDSENENQQANDNFYQNQSSPLSEDEIYQLLNNHVTAQENSSLQCSHKQEFVSQSSSIIENENMNLNDDSF